MLCIKEAVTGAVMSQDSPLLSLSRRAALRSNTEAELAKKGRVVTEVREVYVQSLL